MFCRWWAVPFLDRWEVFFVHVFLILDGILAQNRGEDSHRVFSSWYQETRWKLCDASCGTRLVPSPCQHGQKCGFNPARWIGTSICQVHCSYSQCQKLFRASATAYSTRELCPSYGAKAPSLKAWNDSGSLTTSQMAKAAGCIKCSITNISNNLRRFGNVRAPPTRVGRRRSITPPTLEALCDRLLERNLLGRFAILWH
jgi:hypothetical protein